MTRGSLRRKRRGMGHRVLGACALVLAILILPCIGVHGFAASPDVLRGAETLRYLEVYPKRPYTIGVLIPNLPDPTWQAVVYGMQLQAEKVGNVTLLVRDAGGFQYVGRQLDQLARLVELGVDAIMLGAASSEGIVPGVEQAVARGVPVMNTYVPDASGLAFTFAANDQASIGCAQAEALNPLLQPGDGVAMLNGPAGITSSVDRAQGFKDCLRGDVTILAERWSDSSRLAGLEQTERLISAFGSRLKGIYTFGSFLADGAADALEASQLAGSVYVTTANPSRDTIEAIKAGRILASVSQQNVQQGGIHLGATIAYLNGERVPKRIIPPITVITAENVYDDEVIANALSPEGWRP